MTTERPIIFSGEMVRAILDGEKTQTRRIAKVTSEGCPPGFLTPLAGFVPRRPEQHVEYCPYGQPGDRLWVKESYALTGELANARLRDFGFPRESLRDHLRYRADADGYDETVQRWRPSIHMPRWASRITLEITGVRIERLNEISEADAIAEGVERTVTDDGWRRYATPAEELAGLPPVRSARASFKTLWESIHGPGSWDANPWVWALTFDVIRENVDMVKKQEQKQCQDQ